MTDGSLFDMSAFGEPQTEPEIADDATDTLDAPAPGREANAPKSLYRKYRPQSFEADELFGQEHVVHTLKNAIALDRIAHAYLFCGPRGTGKTTTARILAKAVNCLDPDPAHRPCNRCAACVAINAGASTDVIEIDAASNRGIDDIRDLRERVKYAPSQLKTKFYIIDEAHQITGAAANAFLKTLEEPPAHTKFVLATTDPEDLLQTIVSRCQRFDFRRINLDAMVANLTKIAAAEHIDIDDDAKLLIARHATGSLRDAQGLLDQVAVYRENVDDENTRVTVDLVRTVLGVSRNDRVETIASALADQDAAAAVNAIGEAVEAGDDVRQLARQLLAYLRALLLERAGGRSDLDDNGKQLARRFDLAHLAELTRAFGDIDFKVKHATITQLPLEIAVIEGAMPRQQRTAPSQPEPEAFTPAPRPAPIHEPEWMSSPPSQPVEAPPSAPRPSLKDRVRGAGAGTAASSRPRPEPRQPVAETAQREALPASRPQPQQPQSAPMSAPAAPSSDTTGFNVDALRERWPQILEDVRAINRRLVAVLSYIDPVDVRDGKVSLVSPYPFHRNRVNTDDVRRVLEDVIDRHFRARTSIQCYSPEEWKDVAARMTASPARSAQPDRTPAANIDAQPPAPEIEDAPSTPVFDTSRQIDAIKNIFDAEEEIEPV